MKLQFQQARAQVEFQTVGADFSYPGDRLHLASVVYNLLDNALKYSPVRANIVVTLIQDTEHLTLQVRDRASASPPLTAIKSLKNSSGCLGDVHNVKGHGLGLDYVAGVVSQHQRHIEVESGVGKGTCFTITLPMEKSSLQ